MKVLIVQPDVSWEDRDSNLQHLGDVLSRYKESTDLILLPEMFATGFSMNAELLAENEEGTILSWLKKTAVEYDAAIAGSMIYRESNNYFNRLVWINPGEPPVYYDKRHLFGMGNETKALNRGTKQVIVDYRNWRIMPLICYDLRFPVWSRNVFNYDILCYHANWPAVRNEVWECLLKARAIENQAYVIGINRVGRDGNGIDYIGNSLVYDPRGLEILRLGQKEECGIADLSLDELHEFREKFPALKDRDSFRLEI